MIFRWVSDRRLVVPIPFFAVKATINYFAERGSCVYAAALDLCKAFDSVNHFKLYTAILNSRVAFIVIIVSSEREREFTFAICYRPYVCCLSVTFVHFT